MLLKAQERPLKRKLIYLSTLALVIGLFTEYAAAGPHIDFNPQNTHFHTPSDPKIPNFSHPSNVSSPLHLVSSVRNGNWSDPATWDAVPGPNSVVHVNHIVTFDESDASVHTLGVYNKLQFTSSANTRLRVVHFLVHQGAELTVGTQSHPIPANLRAEIIIRNTPINTNRPTDPFYDPQQYGNGLLVLGGGTLKIFGAAKTSFARLASEPLANGNTLLTYTNFSGWRSGDRLVIPDTNQYKPGRDSLGNRYWNGQEVRWETLEIDRINDSRNFSLRAPLRFNHYGAKDPVTDEVILLRDGEPLNAHVGNLSRNIVIRSETLAETGKAKYCTTSDKITAADTCVTPGHTIAFATASIDINYARYENLGRTQPVALDNTVIGEDGLATHVGSNQIARYAFHMHHVSGPMSPTGPFQFRCVGNAFESTVEAASIQEYGMKWPITLHASHYGLVKGNVLYNTTGSGIVTEDGSESFNHFEDNFVVRTSGSMTRGKHRTEHSCPGCTGAAYWFAGLNNYVSGNIGANSFKSDYEVYGGDDSRPAKVHIPNFQGANPHMEGQGTHIGLEHFHFLSFEDNESYASNLGTDFWYIGFETYYRPTRARTLADGSTVPYGTNRLKDFTIWHPNSIGFFSNQCQNCDLDGLVIIGNKSTISSYSSPGGIQLLQHKNVAIKNFVIKGFQNGILNLGYGDVLDPALPVNAVPPLRIINGTMANYPTELYFRTPHIDQFRGLPPRRTEIYNVLFQGSALAGRVNNPGPYRSIYMYYVGHLNLAQTDIFKVVDYNKVPGQTFEVFYKEQAPDFPFPSSREGSYVSNPRGIVGCPSETQLTNVQCFATYGKALAGRIAPCQNDTTHPEIHGFTCPVGGDSSPPQAPSNMRLR